MEGLLFNAIDVKDAVEERDKGKVDADRGLLAFRFW